MKLRASSLILLVGVLLTIGTALLVGGGVARFAFAPALVGGPEILVEVRPGETPAQVATALEAQGVIRSADDFLFLGRVIRQWKSLKVGEYRVSSSMTPIEIFSVITSGVSAAYRITVREGKNMFQVADAIQEAGLAQKHEFIALCRDKAFLRSLGLTDPKIPSVEGYLYPETYFFNRTLGAKDMIREMVTRFKANWTAEIAQSAQRLRYTQHEVVTLASIIEKETGAPEERPLISSVFHNRLNKRMRLQSDPTTIYGVWETFDGNLRKSHLLEKTPFNTYKIPALPVGAIANPGKEALAAAVAPAKSEYLFFVSRNDGTHVFTSKLEDHERAVRDYQLNRRAREGKSWRDLQKRQAGH
jgi:UPF0755 protein